MAKTEKGHDNGVIVSVRITNYVLTYWQSSVE